MDFEEFLWTIKNGKEYVQAINYCYKHNFPMESNMHKQLLDYYKDYLFVGGMPEAVKTYTFNKDIFTISNIHKNIYDQYMNDMTKYQSNIDTAKTRHLFNNIPNQLNKQNKKFKYSFIRKVLRVEIMSLV